MLFFLLLLFGFLCVGLARMASGGVWSKLKSLDAYPKTLEDFRVKTFSGAAISIVAILLILVLFTSELVYL